MTARHPPAREPREHIADFDRCGRQARVRRRQDVNRVVWGEG